MMFQFQKFTGLWMDGYQVLSPSVETRCFPYFLTNDRMNCSSAISMHASFIIRYAYSKNCLILSFSSIAIHTHTQTNNSVSTLIRVSSTINS